MVFGNWAKILTSDVEVIESQDKDYKVYFDEGRNFVEDNLYGSMYGSMYAVR